MVFLADLGNCLPGDEILDYLCSQSNLRIPPVKIHILKFRNFLFAAHKRGIVLAKKQPSCYEFGGLILYHI